MKSTLSYLLIICSLFTACIGHQEESLLFYVDTRTGTAPSATHTAELFGKNTEEYGQTLPAVLEPNGMNFWTPQTQDTEAKCKAPYYYKDSKNLRKNGRMRAKYDKWLVLIPFLCYPAIFLISAEIAVYGGY
jgi:hypothetical protein